MRIFRPWVYALLLSFFTGIAVSAWGGVRPGSHTLFEAPYYDEIRGKRLAVLAHHASRDAAGRHLVDLLHGATEFTLTTIFAPEHGFRSAEDSLLPDSRDPVTGLPVYSLYGPRRAPTSELLSGVDVIVIDLQDVGMRYYTYTATMALTMQAAAANGKKVIVLDRPNPVGGLEVEGAVLEPHLIGNIAAFAPIATRHGMTLGEVASLYNEMLGIHSDLTVVPMHGWNRGMLWDDTGLEWMAPSPALPNFEQALLYAYFGTLESANLAVGRGQSNDRAFRVYGAPWITPSDQSRIVRDLRALKLPGLQFDPVSWTPDRREYMGKLCRGFEVRVTDSGRVRGFESLLNVLKVMRRQLGSRLKMSGMDAMLGSTWLREALERGEPIAPVLDRVERESEPYRTSRLSHLIY